MTDPLCSRSQGSRPVQRSQVHQAATTEPGWTRFQDQARMMERLARVRTDMHQQARRIAVLAVAIGEATKEGNDPDPLTVAALHSAAENLNVLCVRLATLRDVEREEVRP